MMARGQAMSKHLAKSLLLEESGHPKVVRMVAWFGFAVLAVFIVWSWTTEIDEVTAAVGRVDPTGNVKEIQHIEGGQIAEILVTDGALVRENQVLLRFDTSFSGSELEQIQKRVQSLRLQRERLRSIVADRPFLPSSGQEGLDGEVEDEARLYRELLFSTETKIAVLRDQIAQREAEIEGLRAREQSLRNQIEFLRKEIAIFASLRDQKLVQENRYLELLLRMAAFEGEESEIPITIIRFEAEIREIRNRIVQIRSEVKERALLELTVLNDQIQESEQVLQRRARSVELATVRSPLNGTVHGMAIHTLGGVVAPGDTILQIVPEGQELIAEIEIPPKDIGHIAVGQAVSVHLDAYDFSRFGAVEGKVKSISATTFRNLDGVAYYRGTIELESQVLKTGTRLLPILPGMTLTAYIMTGRKTVLQYFTTPIFESSQQALRER